MLNTTVDAVRAILAADPSVTGDLRAKMIEALKQTGKAGGGRAVDPIVRRLDAAQRLSVSVKTLDLWRRQGRVRAVSFGDGTRAVGFRASTLDAFLNGGAA